MAVQKAMTRSGSATSMSITDTPALSPTNRLSPAERKAFSKPNHKAAKILGITYTRNHVDQNGRLARVPSADQEGLQVGDTLAEMMARIDAKRARNRNSSAVTVFRLHKVEKNKKSRVAGEYRERVILKPLRSEVLPDKEGEEVSTAKGVCSFLEPGESEETETPLAHEYSAGNNEEKEDLFDGSKDFVWDVQDPFAKPPNAILQQYIEAMRRGETIGPLDVAPTGYTTNFEPSPEVLYSNDDMLRLAEQPMEGRRQRRAAVWSENEMLDVLGADSEATGC